MSQRDISRAFELQDLETNVDQRAVVAYASVFNDPVEILDRNGHYYESIARTAFDVTLRAFNERKNRRLSGEKVDLLVKAMVNHGQDIYGQPSDRFALPYGTVESMETDGRGLLTVTRVADTALGDEVLELLRAGAMTGFSFSGRIINSQEIEPVRSGDLPTMVRTEIALREFGPAPFQAYDNAQLLEVRSGRPLPLPQNDKISDGDEPSVRSSSQSDGPPASDGSGSDGAEQEHASPQDAAGREPNAALLWLRDQIRDKD